jgi:hypothetical protein
MKIEITKNDIDNIISENDKAIAALNQLIDKELEKKEAEIDFALIDEYSNALTELHGGIRPEELELSDDASKRILREARRHNKSKIGTVIKVLLVAAVILASSLTANAAVSTITGQSIVQRIVVSVNDKEKKHKKKKHAEEETGTTAARYYFYHNSSTGHKKKEKQAQGIAEALETEEETTAEEETTEEEVTEEAVSDVTDEATSVTEESTTEAVTEEVSDSGN